MWEAEKDVIANIVSDNNCIAMVQGILTPDMFNNELLKSSYKYCLQMYDLDKRVTYKTLVEAMRDKFKNDEYVDNIMQELSFGDCFSINAKMNAERVAREYRSRQVQNLFGIVDTSSTNIDATINDVIAELEHLRYSEKKTMKHISKIVEENKGEYFKPEAEAKGVKTGFFKLDQALVNLNNGSVTVIAARPAVGKSIFATQIAKNVSAKGKRVGMFSLEMSDDQIYERMLVGECDIELTRLKQANAFLGGEEEAFQAANEKLSAQNIWIGSDAYSVADIFDKCRNQDYDLIIIDYLQLVEPEKTYNGNRQAEVGAISRGIKKIALRLNVPIIAISQLNRAVEGRRTNEPSMSELRESGAIEQDADNIIILWNIEDGDNKHKGCKIEKCRQGKLAKIGLKFDGGHMTFTESLEEFSLFEKHVKKNNESFDDLGDNSAEFDYFK